MADTIAEYIAAFREAALEKGAGLGGPQDRRLYDGMAEAYHALVALGGDGAEALTQLLTDPSVEVRVWAASALLHHKDSRARSVLEEIASGPGMQAFNATMTLQEFDAGRLKHAFPRRGA